MRKKLLVWLLVLFLGIIYLPTNVSATTTINDTITYVNPLYEDVLDEEQINQLISQQNQSSLLRRTGTSSQIYTTIEDAAKYVRNEFIARNTNVTLEFESKSDDYSAIFNDIIDQVFLHTGNPKEGDYIRFHFYRSGGPISIEENYNTGIYHYTYTFNTVFLSDSKQEKVVDEEVPKIIEQLDLKDKSDYEKIKAIYDYICNHVTYDYEHLDDNDYLLQYTAYAALINKTSVCQGYANLFYRLALEAGVDARIISGKSSGGNHAWNIVELDGQYYNLDSTWDAGYSKYYYFLKSMDEFDDHLRNDEYKGTFDIQYPMSEYSYYIIQEDDEVTLNKLSSTLDINETEELKAYINNTRVKPTSWVSSNENIAIVDKNGKVTTIAPGQAIITAKISNGKSANFEITVIHVHVWNDEYTIDVPATTTSEGQKSIHCSVCDTTKEGTIVSIPKVVIPITSVKLNKTSVSVYKGKTYQLTATVSPTNTTNSKTIKWTSSNTKVATVSSSGKITGINYGKATITATTSNGKKATCSVTVPYTITYKLNYGTNSKYNPSSYYGTKITLKNPTRKGYIFAGWYTDSRFKTRITSFSSGNKTVYAKWTKVTVSKAKTPTLTNLSGRKLKITYSATSGAKGYQIQYATNSKFSGATTKTLTGRSATYTLTKGKTYYVRVRAYKIDSTGAKVYGSWSYVRSKKITK